MADDKRPDETVEERRARRIAEAKAKLAAKQNTGDAGPDEPVEDVREKRGPGTVSASAEGLIAPGARPADETAADVKALAEGPGGAVESTTEVGDATPASVPASGPPGDETPEQKRARRIAEAKAKLAAKAPPEAPPPPAPPAQAPADETPEQRRARKIAEAKAKLAAQAPEPPPAPPADETPEQKRARRIAEAKAKLATQTPAEPAPQTPPADETPEQRRARKIAEAKAKLAGGAPAPPPADETPDQRRARKIAEAKAKLTPQETAAAAPPSGPGTPPSAAPAPAPAGAGKTPPAKRSKAGAETQDISDESVVRALRARFADAITSAVGMVGQKIVTVDTASLPEVLLFLRTDGAFDLLLDLTAVHRPEEAAPFEVVYQLVSTSTLDRVRVKAALADGARVPTASGVWPTANWLEREVFDMFGIVFDGHPDLRRILLPEGWEGHPLRKEYPVEFQENAWVREHLNIVEIPADADFTGKFEV